MGSSAPDSKTRPEKIMHDVSEAFSSNAIRLDGLDWLAVAVLFLLLAAALPAVQQRTEPFSPDPDYRLPYSLSEDYYLWSRFARHVARAGQIAVIGDSVVWGHYVAPNATLSHFLNESLGRPAFANLGLDGSRPVALAGLVRYYGTAIHRRRVVLHFNPLWLSSHEADMSPPPDFKPPPALRHFVLVLLHRAEPPETVSLNHARLVPQVFDKPFGYHPSVAEAMSAVVERRSAYLSWLRHLRIVYFDGLSLTDWTMQNPHRSPLSAITGHLPPPEPEPQDDARPWRQRGIEIQDFKWVPLDRSYQWRYFKRTLQTLRRRGNDLFVLVGPLNTHMMTPAAAATYQKLLSDATAWLKSAGVPFAAPDPLPSDLYADTSHPLADGYRRLARALLSDHSFREWLAAGL